MILYQLSIPGRLKTARLPATGGGGGRTGIDLAKLTACRNIVRAALPDGVLYGYPAIVGFAAGFK